MAHTRKYQKRGAYSKVTKSYYIIDPSDQSQKNKNYIKALSSLLKNSSITTIDYESQPDNDTWSHVEDYLKKGKSFRLDCETIATQSTIGIFPKIEANVVILVNQKNIESKRIKKLFDSANRTREQVKGAMGLHNFTDQGPEVPLRLLSMPIENQDEAWYFLGEFLTQFELHDVTGIWHFKRHQAILVQIDSENYCLRYANNKLDFSFFPKIHFDLVEGYHIYWQGEWDTISVFFQQTESDLHKNFRKTCRTSWDNYCKKNVNTNQNAELGIDFNMNRIIEIVYKKMTDRHSGHENIPNNISEWLRHKEKVRETLLNELKADDTSLDRIKEFAAKPEMMINKKCIFINMDDDKKTKTFEYIDKFFGDDAIWFKMVFDLQERFLHWMKNDYIGELNPLSEANVPHGYKTTLAAGSHSVMFPKYVSQEAFKSGNTAGHPYKNSRSIPGII